MDLNDKFWMLHNIWVKQYQNNVNKHIIYYQWTYNYFNNLSISHLILVNVFFHVLLSYMYLYCFYEFGPIGTVSNDAILVCEVLYNQAPICHTL